MVATSVLLANEPRAYRDTLAVALRLLRPQTTILVADPETLDDCVLQHAPRVVVCSRLTSLVETHVQTWIILYPHGASGAMVHVRGERTTVNGMDLEGIARLIDQADSFARIQTC
jgi:hypothetical protein